MASLLARDLSKDRTGYGILLGQLSGKSFARSQTSFLSSSHSLGELTGTRTGRKALPKVSRYRSLRNTHAQLLHPLQQPTKVLVFFVGQPKPGFPQSLRSILPALRRPCKSLPSLQLGERSRTKPVANTLWRVEPTRRRRTLPGGQDLKR